MKKSVTVSAPGKLMLLGEHAVVYGHPCLVTAVDQRMHVSVALRAESLEQRAKLYISAPDVNINGYEKSLSDLGKGEIPKGVRFVEIAVKNFFDNLRHSRESGNLDPRFLEDVAFGLDITTKSDFSSQFGFGSSSASTVCVVKALSELFDIKLSNKEIFDIAYKTVLDIQGKGSGFDVAAAVYGGTLYFVTGGKTILPLATLPAGRQVRHLPLIVGYSGVKADTVQLIKMVDDKRKENKDWVDGVFGQITDLVERGKVALLAHDFVLFGDIMNKNQELLSSLGVSSEKLGVLCKAALDAGAYGAKLSGAGGGDCMIALRAKSEEQSVQEAIEKAGGMIIDVTTNAEGVRIE